MLEGKVSSRPPIVRADYINSSYKRLENSIREVEEEVGTKQLVGWMLELLDDKIQETFDENEKS